MTRWMSSPRRFVGQHNEVLRVAHLLLLGFPPFLHPRWSHRRLRQRSCNREGSQLQSQVEMAMARAVETAERTAGTHLLVHRLVQDV